MCEALGSIPVPRDLKKEATETTKHWEAWEAAKEILHSSHKCTQVEPLWETVGQYLLQLHYLATHS